MRHRVSFKVFTGFCITMFFLIFLHIVTLQMPTASWEMDTGFTKVFIGFQPMIDVFKAFDSVNGQLTEIEFWIGVVTMIGAFFTRKKTYKVQ